MPVFDILGCCVSRDIFNFLDQEMYTINSAITLYTNSTTYSRKMEPLADYLDLFSESLFKRRMASVLINGINFESKTDVDRWLILDFANERFPLQNWKIGKISGLMPVCWETYQFGEKIKAESELSISDWHFPDRESRQYKEQIQKYISDIVDCYGKNHIIYCSLRMLEDVRNDGKNMILSLNDDNTFSGQEKQWIRKKAMNLSKLLKRSYMRWCQMYIR